MVDGGRSSAQASDEFFTTHLSGPKVLAILRGLGPERTLKLAIRAWDAGVRCVEIPVQSDQDLATLELVASCGAAMGRVVGAGTVVDPGWITKLAAAGAAFTVSPGFDSQVVQASLDAGLPTLAGVATPSEVQGAMRLGLHWLKAFPAAELGRGWVSAMHGPFPRARFVATGGVDVRNTQELLKAGYSAVSLGNALTDPMQVDGLRQLLTRVGTSPSP